MLPEECSKNPGDPGRADIGLVVVACTGGKPTTSTRCEAARVALTAREVQPPSAWKGAGIDEAMLGIDDLQQG